MKKHILQNNVFILLVIVLLFVSCNNDNDNEIIPNLKISTTETTLTVGGTVEVKIVSGTKSYNVTSENMSIVTASLADTTVIIKGIAEGTTNVTVTDTKSKQTAIIRATVTTPKMILVTSKNVGEEIELLIDAAIADQANVWIDLNNDGKRAADKSEEVKEFGFKYPFLPQSYKIGAQTVTIYGKVTILSCYQDKLTSLTSYNPSLIRLDCFTNELKKLDLSNSALTSLNCSSNLLMSSLNIKNTNLNSLVCEGCSLKAEEMAKILNELPDRKIEDNAEAIIFNNNMPDTENNELPTLDALNVAFKKNWTVIRFKNYVRSKWNGSEWVEIGWYD